MKKLVLCLMVLTMFMLTNCKKDVESRSQQYHTSVSSTIFYEEYDSIRVEQAKQDSIFFLTTKGKRVKQLMDEYGWDKETATKIVIDEVIWIGMPVQGVVVMMGNPNSINVSNYGSGIRRQYVWYNCNPSCFYDDDDDGLVDAYN